MTSAMHHIASLILLALQFGATAVASATATLGPVHQVTGDEPFCQNRPLLAPLRSGSFAVAWNDSTWPSQVVRLRLADGTGPIPVMASSATPWPCR